VGAPLSGLVMIGMADKAINALITPNHAQSITFRHAVEVEKDYCDALAGFNADEPPFYYNNSIRAVDLDGAASHRVLCLIVQDQAGRVSVTRNYGGVEVPVLEGASLQFSRIWEIFNVGSAYRRVQ
jgi:hypothetical protein